MSTSGGGSGGSGTQRYEWNDSLRPHWVNAIEQANDMRVNQPYRRYEAERIAPINQDQASAMNNLRHVGMYGTPTSGQATEQIANTLGGNYLTGPGRNPYADANNPWRDWSADIQRNQYSGESPQFRQMVGNSLEDITNAYNQGTAADTTRMFNLSGAFGGSAHQKALANNQGALAKQLSNTTTGLYNDQFQRSAGLEESYLGRDAQNQWLDRQFGSQADENAINRGYNAFEAERGRQQGAVGNSYQDQNAMMQRYQGLMGVGDIQRGYNQDRINLDYQDWQEAQNHPARMLDYFTGILSRAQGGVAPNVTTTQNGFSASPFSQVLGAGLAGYGLLGG